MIRTARAAAIGSLLLSPVAGAAATDPSPPTGPARPLADLAFLVGDWSAGSGQVADTGGTSTGRSSFTLEADSQAMLRRDHSDLADPSGKPVGGFDQVMLIYPEAGTLRADYAGGGHVIHYRAAEVSPGRAVTFTSTGGAGEPVFRLAYRLTAPTTLAVEFAMRPPGGGAFRPIATGSLTRATAR